MANDVFDFRWSVPEDGYRWVQACVYVTQGEASRLEDVSRWVLTSGLATGMHYRKWQYAPLQNNSGLFRTFAQLPMENRDAILEFANRYGQLGIGRLTDIEVEQDQKIVAGFWGETWEDWKQAIEEMRRAVEVWRLVDARDRVGLSRLIRRKNELWIYDSHPELRDVETPEAFAVPPPGRVSEKIDPVLDLFTPDDVFTPAEFLVQRWINQHLKGRATPQLRYDPDRGRRVLQIIPESLLSAMWLQFARWIDGDRKFRRCKECGEWFEISTKGDGFRVNREFCSDRCKSKDYRDRKQRAQRLKTTGRAVKDIARELDTDVETIKKWVTKRKG
jgi:hypothetical protein